MSNYLLFKQVAALLLFFETLVLWTKFSWYFGPQPFPGTWFTTRGRIAAFNIFLLTTLVSLFFDYYSIVSSFFLFLMMRYLYVTDKKDRLGTAGAVGYVCYLTAAYLFFFEASFALDSTHRLANFLQWVFAIEIGVIMMAAGIYKSLLGYLKGEGFEYALVNPAWSKFFFIFKEFPSSSWIFKIQNYACCIGEILCGLFFFMPALWIWGAYLLVGIFFYVFLVVRVSVLPLLMMCFSLLYFKPLGFHFPVLDARFPSLGIPHWGILLVEGTFIMYLVAYIVVVIIQCLKINRDFSLPDPLERALEIFIAYRPLFEWGVFTVGMTNFYIQIQKASKSEKNIVATVYDGFSKNYREALEDPSLFLRFIHHHEQSFLLGIFVSFFTLKEPEDKLFYISQFINKLVRYGKTLERGDGGEKELIVYTVMSIQKTSDQFLFKPLFTFFVDLDLGLVVKTIVY